MYTSTVNRKLRGSKLSRPILNLFTKLEIESHPRYACMFIFGIINLPCMDSRHDRGRETITNKKWRISVGKFLILICDQLIFSQVTIVSPCSVHMKHLRINNLKSNT
jgi:hypothetical protein